MRKGIMALEGLEEEVGSPDGELASEVAELQVTDAVLGAQSEQIGEAEEIRETVGDMTDKIAEGIESGEGVSEDVAEVLEVAVEHFCKRLGYKKQVMPSLEGFADKAIRLTKSKMALENLNELSTRLGKTIAISQEGVIDIAGKHFVDLVATDASLAKQLKAAVSEFTSNGAKEGSIASTLALRRVFSAGGKTNVTGASAIVDLKEYVAIHKALNTGMDRLAEISRELNEHSKESTFIAKDEFVKKIETLKREAETITGDLVKLDYAGDKGGQGDAEYAVLTKAEVGQIDRLVEQLLDTNENEFGQIFSGHTGKAQDALSHNQIKGGIRLMWESSFRLLGIFASDTRKINAARSDIEKSVRVFMSAYVNLTAASHSAIAYIKASTK
jgi:hypothetical protein